MSFFWPVVCKLELYSVRPRLQYLRKVVSAVKLLKKINIARIIGPGNIKLTIDPILAPKIAAGKITVMIL